MSSLNEAYLSRKLGDYIRKRPGGDVGIELEIEGSFPKWDQTPLCYWTAKPEGSLRSGLEFVLRRPVKMVELSAAIEELARLLREGKPKKSIRCSTHIHVNVLQKTTRELMTIIGYYYLCENLFVETQGPLRKGNLFCLRLSDAETPINDLCSMLDHESTFTDFGLGAYKYGALNLGAPARFGSIEFRFFRPMDPPDIERWSVLLKRMVDNVPNKSLAEYLSYLRDGQISEFFRPFTTDEVNFISGGRSPSQLRDILTDNYMLVHKLQKSLDKKKKYRMPFHLIPDDLQDASPFNNPDIILDELVAQMPPGEWTTIDDAPDIEDGEW